jgi:hypothetical protein
VKETNTDGTALVDVGAFAGDPTHEKGGKKLTTHYPTR